MISPALQLTARGCLLASGAALVTIWALAFRRRRGRHKFPQANLRSLQSFELVEVLKDEDDGRVVTLLGRFSWQDADEKALVKLIATPLSLSGLKENLRRLCVSLKSESGAEYAFYDCYMSPWASFLRGLQGNSHNYSLEVVAPAPQRTIDRSRSVPTVMVSETAEMHASRTAPFIDEVLARGNSLTWLFNVLAKKKEAERILYADDQENGFLMTVDTKWRTHPDVSSVPRAEWFGHSSVADLYCLAICHKRGIRTLRDLRSAHVPMLQEMYRRGVETIEAVYGVPEDQLRVFVHYLPQFFHFHVHFTRVHNSIGVEVERAHLLLDIIQNLQEDGEFYSRRTMQFRLRQNDALLKALKNNHP
ncbi:unnamed protein product [Ascophyllum nodosum]